MAEAAPDNPGQQGTSLARRLLILSLGWTLALLLGTGLVLSAYNKTLVEQNFDRRLQVYVKALIADIANAVDDQEVVLGSTLAEPMFELPQSGWYWQVTRTDGAHEDVRASRSLWDKKLEPLGEQTALPGVGRTRSGYVKGPDEQRLRALERTVELGDDGEFSVIVAGNADDMAADLERFRSALVRTLSILGFGLVIAAFFQVRFGLRPLHHLTRALTAIRNGERQHLEGRFPNEITPLVGELNALLDQNREVVERARTHVGNLAHALKTPLSVIQNEAEASRSALAAKVSEQADIMRQQVSHHLERARMAARTQVATTLSEVAPVIEALTRTMAKIHRERGLAIETVLMEGMRFRGEQHDLEEMLGNLLDNACKWASSRVKVSLSAPAGGSRPSFMVAIDDDGIGLSEEQRREIGRRGRRLDESKPGTGLGLSIVSELAALYGGRLSFEASPLGGLRVVLALPRA